MFMLGNTASALLIRKYFTYVHIRNNQRHTDIRKPVRFNAEEDGHSLGIAQASQRRALHKATLARFVFFI